MKTNQEIKQGTGKCNFCLSKMSLKHLERLMFKLLRKTQGFFMNDRYVPFLNQPQTHPAFSDYLCYRSVFPK